MASKKGKFSFGIYSVKAIIEICWNDIGLAAQIILYAAHAFNLIYDYAVLCIFVQDWLIEKK